MKRFRLSVLCIAAVFAIGFTTLFAQTGHGHGSHATASTAATAAESPLSSATVSFGGWMTTPPLDRFPNVSDRFANHHEVIPELARIKAGGTVNFIIGGFHQVIVYDNGTQPGSINKSLTVLPTAGGPPLIDDPAKRIYRGLDPSLQPQDRVEVVHFAETGTYLVICGVLPHFVEGMYGFVRVQN